MAGGARTNAREPAAALLAAGRTVADTAGAVGVSERQVGRWLQDPTFKARVRSLQSEILDQAVAVLRAKATRAAEVLGELLESGDDKLRLRAADVLLARLTGSLEVLALRDEVAEMREVLAAMGADREGLASL